MKKKTTSLKPFIPLMVRAVIDSTPEEQAVLLALGLLEWWLGPGPKGLELIMAVLVNPSQPARVKAGLGDTKEQLGQITERAVKRALARLKARGWVETARGFGERTGYTITVPEMAFQEAYATIKTRMPERLRAVFFPGDAPAAMPTVFDMPLSDKPAPAPAAPVAAEGGTEVTDVPAGWEGSQLSKDELKQAQDELWKHWTDLYKAKFNQKPTWPIGKWVSPAIAKLVVELGVAENKRRLTNMAEDPFITNPTFGDYLAKPDRFITRREPFKKGGSGGRTFHSPDSAWRPSQAS